MGRLTHLMAALLAMTLATPACGAEDLAARARQSLERGVEFFTTKVATRGGYLWWYSEDLQERWGETQATASQIWVQPPGTPAVGEAFLRAYRATGDQRYLEAARAAARALAWGQLETGGWDYRIDFDEEQSRRWYFRRDQGKLTPEEAARRRNTSTFDDDNSQSALRFLMGVCRETKDAEIQEALDYGLAFLLKAQYPNGAWPQRYPPPKSGYGSYYTFNDDTIRDCVRTALAAHRHTGRAEFLDAAKRAGDFILKAQQPEPQPVWAQQYDHDMKPAWARKFEPPSVCSSESVGVMRTLIDLYIETGEERFLAPIPRALAWFERSQIAPNRWARFYELGTNRPLYFTKKYELVYTDHDLPTHYSFQGEFGVRRFIATYEEVKKKGREAILRARESTQEQRAARAKALAPRVEAVIASQDPKGRWLNKGRIECGTFVRNLNTLSEYLEMAGSAPAGK
jgi:PelA/Pel-15E family pectate lyase